LSVSRRDFLAGRAEQRIRLGMADEPIRPDQDSPNRGKAFLLGANTPAPTS
jgi:hypothetical protein